MICVCMPVRQPGRIWLKVWGVTPDITHDFFYCLGLYPQRKEGNRNEVNGSASGFPLVSTLTRTVSTTASHGLVPGHIPYFIPEMFVG